MGKTMKVLSLLMSVFILVGCGAPPAESEQSIPETLGTDGQTLPVQGAEKAEHALAEIAKLGQSPEDDYRVWYEIFVYSYCDSDGDGIGDLKGVISKLDELEKLGIGGIWLMPIHPSTSYHKYNVTDYYAVDPAYGTMEDFEALIEECDRRDIKVIVDLVLNHTGSEHAWFKQAASYLKELPQGQQPDLQACPYVDYYNFVQAETCPPTYCPVDGAPGWFYEGHFSPEMPDLNFDSQTMRAELRKIMEFWLDKGVSGFRLDAAKEFYSDVTEKNIEVLSWIQQTATEIKPECYLVAEVWESFDTIARYYESGITSIFNYAFGNNNGKIIKVLQGAGNASVVSTYATALVKADGAYRKSNADYIDAPFLSNHDVGRIAGFVGRDPAKTKLAGAMNLFMSGNVFIYYGEEIGMVCGAVNDPSYRSPMHWNEAADQGTTQPPPGCTVPEEYPMGSLEAQRSDDASVYNYYRQAVAIRNALGAISHGQPEVEAALNTGCVSAVRKTWNDDSCIILMNIDKSPAQVDLSDYAQWGMAASLSADTNPVTKEGNTLYLPAFGTAVLVPEK